MSSPQNSAESTSRLGSIVRQSGTVFIGKIVFNALNVFSAIVLARILGPTLLGNFQLGLVVTQLVTIFSVLGFETGLMRYLPMLQSNAPGRERSFVSFNVLFSGLLSLFFSALLFVFAPALAHYYFHSEEMTTTLRLCCLYVPVLSLVRVTSGALAGAKRADLLSNVTNIVCPILYLLCIFAIGLFHGGLFQAIGARIVTQVAAVLIFMRFLMNRYPSKSVPESGAKAGYTAGGYLGYSTPLMLIGLTYFLVGNLDVMMLGYFVSDREVGLYSAAAKISLFVVLGLEILLPIIGPHFAELSIKEDRVLVKSLFNNTTKWVFYSGMLVFGVIAVLRTEVLALFGKGFSEGTTVLMILMIGQLVNAMTGPTGQLLVMTGRQRWEVGNTVVLLVANIVLNIVLIPRFGMTGAAMSTALSMAVVNLVKLVQVYALYSFVPYEVEYLKGVFATLAAAAICYSARMALHSGTNWNAFVTLALCGSIFLAVFSVTVSLLGFTPEDRQMGQSLLLRVTRRSAAAS